MNPELTERLERCGHLPTLPAVALRLIELGRDPEVRLGQLAETINFDPALVAKVLRIANSAFYGRRRESHNLRQAVTLLGLEATLSLALSFSLVAALRGGSGGELDYGLFWRRALLSATCARALGNRVELRSKEQLFLAGLLQDIGMLALDRALPEVYQDMGDTQRGHQRLQQWELERTGSDHAEVGAWLLRRWRLSEYLVDAVAGSHDPSLVATDDGRFRAFLRCVAVSGVLADLWLRDDPARVAEAAESAEHHLRLSPSDLAALLEAVASELPEVEALFEGALVSSAEVEGVLKEAKEILAARELPVVEPAEEPAGAPSQDERAGKVRKLRDAGALGGALVERSVLEQTLREEFEIAGRYHWPLSLALVDLDDFDQLRRTYGGTGVAAVLTGAASLLFDYTRYSDVLARHGERGIAIILPGVGIEASRALCERIVQAFASSSIAPEPGKDLILRVSVGMVTHGERSMFFRAEDLLTAGERAMREARAAGGNRAVIYESNVWY
jgi:diguanylate cyclase (GGDEF)-like protein